MSGVLLIGAGAIAREILKQTAGDASIRITHAIELPQFAEKARQSLGSGIEVVTSIADLSEMPEFVVECAGHEAVKNHVPAFLRRGIDVTLVSVGCLADPGLPEMLEAAAREGRAQLTLISGAIAGIDAIASARVAGLDEVVYTGRKPPLGWLDTPAEKKVDLRTLKEATPIFEGSAGEAARLYPKNANVAATVALAGLGLDKTRATLIADPGVTRNIHQVNVRGAFGELELRIAGKPLPDNPKTSALAAYSAVRSLRNRYAPVCI